MPILPKPPKVFISYRHDPAVDLATRIRTALESRGVDVFQDYPDLQKGEFAPQIIQAIEERLFLPVLMPGTLNRCRQDCNPEKPPDEADWVLKEIVHATEHDSPCIPLFTSAFQFSDLHTFLPEAAAERLNKQQGVKIDQYGLFKASVQDLLRHLEPRTWVRTLWHPWVRRGIYASLILVLLAELVVIGFLGERAINPPPLDPITLPDPKDASRALGWQSGLSIRDVAVQGQNIWLATDQGLWLYYGNKNEAKLITAVSDPIFLVDTNADGSRVWFVFDDDQVGDLAGYYDVSTNHMEPLPLVLNGYPVKDSLLSLAVSPDGEAAWIGANFGGIIQYVGGKWSAISICPPGCNPDVSIPVTALTAQQATNNTTFWTTNQSSVYWGTDVSGSQWDILNSFTTGYDWLINPIDIEMDAYGNLWIAHESGVGILFTQGDAWDARQTRQVNCTTRNSPLLAAPVYSLSASDSGRQMWLVSEGGVNRVDTSKDVRDCDRFQWYRWDASDSDDPFWIFTSGFDPNLRIDADPGASGSIWVFQNSTSLARIFEHD